MSLKLVRTVGAAVVVATVLTFAVNVRNGFIRYDDYEYIVLNHHLEPGLTPQTAWWSFAAAGYASNWHPLAWISHAADISLVRTLGLAWRSEENDVGIVTKTSGAFPALVHAENVLWHAANACLLWLLMMTFARSRGEPSPWMPYVAAGAALLWALHPLRVEVVAWASERKELLSVFFMLLTLITYIRGADGVRALPCGDGQMESSNASVNLNHQPQPHPTTLHLPLITSSLTPLLFFILALLAKPVAVSLPAVIFVLDYAFARRSFRESLLRALPFVAVAAAVCLLTMLSQTAGLAGGRNWSWRLRIVCAVEAPAIYLKQTFWPTGLCIDYNVPGWESWPYFAAGAALLPAMAAGCVCWLRRPNRWTALGVLAVAWCYVGLLPMIGLVKVGYEPHSDRYTYWIGCGAAFCLFLAVDWLTPKWERERTSLAKFAGVVLLALGLFSVNQSLVWKDTVTLFSQAVSVTKSAFFAHGLADDYVASQREAGRDKAERMLRDLVSENPTAEAQATFAFHLAAYCEGTDTVSLDDEKVSPFIEARLSAEQALAGGDCTGLAYAALGFADYREEKYVSAYENMKKAVDCGFKSAVIPVKLEEWKRKADEQSKKESKDVQG